MIVEYPPTAIAATKALSAIQTLKTVAAAIEPTRHMSHAAISLSGAVRRSLEFASLLETRVIDLVRCRCQLVNPQPGETLTDIATLANAAAEQLQSAPDWLSSKIHGPMPAVFQRDYFARLRAEIGHAA